MNRSPKKGAGQYGCPLHRSSARSKSRFLPATKSFASFVAPPLRRTMALCSTTAIIASIASRTSRGAPVKSMALKSRANWSTSGKPLPGRNTGCSARWYAARILFAALAVGANLYLANGYHFGRVVKIDQGREFPDGTNRPGALIKPTNTFAVWVPLEKLTNALVVQ